MVKVSVIVPIYNAERYLKQCLDSIKDQTLTDIEVIMIDDGSTDRSAEISNQYLTDSRFSYYFKENEGLAAARADGIERANGEYIGFIDSDDWIEPDMYEKMYTAAKSNDSDIVFCNCIQNENGHRFTPEMRLGAFSREQIKAEILPKVLAYISKDGSKRSIRWSNCLRIYRKQAIEENSIKFDRRFRRSQDLPFTYEMTLAAQNYYYLGDDYLYHNRVVGDSLSRGYTKNMWNLYVPLIERLYEDTEEFSELDLMPQMHLRAFFFVTDCIENEMKNDCPNDMPTRIKLIESIMNHPICERYYGKIQIEKMNPLYQQYYKLIHEKDAKGIFVAKRKYENKIRIKQKYINPVIDLISENKVTGKIYKKIRHKRKSRFEEDTVCNRKLR